MTTDRFRVQATPGRGSLSRRAALGRLAGGSAAAALLVSVGRGIARAEATAEPEGEQGVEPNHFELAGTETRITYSAATDAGEPRLTYDGPFVGRGSFGSGDVRTEESVLGRLVTTELGAFPDVGTARLILLLPAFNPMNVGDDPAPFSTVAIVKWLVSTIAGPPREGALEAYDVVLLEGTAEVIAS